MDDLIVADKSLKYVSIRKSFTLISHCIIAAFGSSEKCSDTDHKRTGHSM